MDNPHMGLLECVCETSGNPCDRHPVGATTPKPSTTSPKEHLKITRRSFNAPQSSAKRLKASSGEQTDVPSKQAPGEASEKTDTVTETTLRTDLLHLRDTLKKDVREKTETLRRLKMAKMYRTKNDLTALQDLIQKWRQCSQAVLYELQSALPIDGRKASLGQLMDRLGLDDSLLHFDRTMDDFIDP